MHIRKAVPLVFGTVLFASACSDTEQPTSPPVPASARNSAALQESLEKVALREVTRGVALALQDEGLRQRVKNDLRTSRHTAEHKLHLTSYLNGSQGGILLAKMTKATGKSRDEILALIAQVRPLEFYMPVPEHRGSWTGGKDLLVVSLLDDHTIPAGYDLNGRQVTLDAERAPTTPALAIVPLETDFSKELPARTPNKNDGGGRTIGTLCETCLVEDDGTSGGGGGGSTGKPAGLYMTYSSIQDDGEAWAKGDPEIEVHVHGQYTGGGTYGKDLSCAGDRVTNSVRNFNQDNKTWSGEVLLFSKSEIDSYNSQFSEGFNVMMWEDDDTACTIKTDKDITGLLKLTAGVLGSAALVVMPKADRKAYATAAGLFIGTLYSSASWLLSNDDFLGDTGESSPGSEEQVLMVGDQYNGTITLRNLYY